MTSPRVNYREGQTLESDDLIDEQVFRIAMRRRHNIAHHGWGVVTGLQLVCGESLIIQPGFAIDGYGRELVLSQRYEVDDLKKLRCRLADRLGPGPGGKEKGPAGIDGIDVWLVYQHHPSSPAEGEVDCESGQFSRITEDAAVRCTPAVAKLEPRRPPFVPDEDYDFPPHREPPDEPETVWPVFLGRIEFVLPEKPHPARPNARLVAASLNGVSGSVRAELVEETRDRARFAIQTRQPDGAVGDGDATVDGDVRQWQERFSISHTNQISLTGRVHIQGQVRLGPEEKEQATAGSPTNSDTDSAKLETEAANEIRLAQARQRRELARLRSLRGDPDLPNSLIFAGQPVQLPVARPWQLYRTLSETEDAAQNKIVSDELRIELPFSEDLDPTRQTLVIGACPVPVAPGANATCLEKDFRSVVSISADDVVFVDNLEVTGQLVTGPIGPDPQDLRYRREWLNYFTDGITAAIRALRKSVLEVVVEVTDGPYKVNVKITNRGSETVILTSLFGTYFVGPEGAETTPKHYQETSSDPPITNLDEIKPNTTLSIVAGQVIVAGQDTPPPNNWPIKSDPSGDRPLKLVVSAVGRNKDDFIVFGRGQDTLPAP